MKTYAQLSIICNKGMMFGLLAICSNDVQTVVYMFK